MALNLPMPDIFGSFGKGFGLTDNLMQQILGRNELRQKKEQFEKELEFKKKQEQRLGANQDLNRQILEQQLLRLKNPNYEFDQFMHMFGGNQGTQGTKGTGGDQYPDLKKMFAGQGMFPEGEIRTWQS